jgi:hypothetical protein
MKPQDDEVFNDFEHYLSYLGELNKKLLHENNNFKKLKFCVLARATLQKYVNEYSIDIETIEKIHEYEKEFCSFPSSSYDPSVSKNFDPASAVVDIKPIFNPESVPTIFDSLKCFFTAEHQKILLHILNTGGDSNEPLIFLDNGNRLADSFKQLYNCGMITCCEKKELENWICRNFRYRYRQNIVAFTIHYLNLIISTNKDLCQNPIIDVKKDRITGHIVISKI